VGKSYSLQLFEYSPALDEHAGCLATKPPTKEDLCITNFIDPAAKFFHTNADSGKVCISTTPKVLGIIVDQSGSMTWNDSNGDRTTFYKNMLDILRVTYPNDIYINLLSYGGTLVKAEEFLVGADTPETSENSINLIKTQILSDSVYDLASVRVVRKMTGFPSHPHDGVIVADSIIENVKDENLQIDTTYYYTVFTYNELGHFSDGVPIEFTVRDRVLPRGVVLFSALPRILPGVERDSSTSLILNFAEESGTVLYDSSGNNNHVNLAGNLDEDQFWLGESTSSVEDEFRVYFGGRFNETGYIESMSTSQDFVISTTNDVTVNLWVYRYSANNEITAFSSENASNFQYQINIDTNGRVHVTSIGSTINLTSSGIVTEKEWTMISVVFSNVGNLNTSIYINGIFDNSTATVYPASISSALARIGGSLHSSDFNGAISNVSCHTAARSLNYISNLYAQESQIFFQRIANNEQQPVDNGQREVLVEWVVPSGFDYEDGQIKIIKKYENVPSNIDDGIEVTTESASAGSFAFLDVNDLVNGSNFFYRIFTINSFGNACHHLDARIFPVYIPVSQNAALSTPLEQVNATIAPSDKKIQISWDSISDTRVKGVKIFYSTVDFPVINEENSRPVPWDSGARPFFTGNYLTDTTDTFYTHRTISSEQDDHALPLSNGVTYYYTLVTYDERGRISSPVHLQTVPLAEYADVIFPPDDVKNIWAEIVNQETLSLHWENPSANKIRAIGLWFDQVAIFYLNVIDIYGSPVSDLGNFNLDVSQSVFKLGDNDIDRPTREYILRVAGQSDGIIRGYITHIEDREILSNTEKYEFFLTPKYSISKVESLVSLFTYTLPNLKVSFYNPVSIETSNLLGKFVEATSTDIGALVDTSYSGRPCPERFCAELDEGGEDYSDAKANGGYILSHEPYICRVFVYYRGELVPEGTPIEVNLYKGGTDIPAEYTSIRIGTYATITQEVELLDDNGRPTGFSELRSFIDIPMDAPSHPELVDIYAKFTYNGIWVETRHSVLWASTLKMEIQAFFPVIDGIDIAEQFCHIYFVDPDDPDSVEKRTPIRDDVLVKWEIKKGQFYKERPFYSLDTIAEQISGVYSRTRDGTARNVWFGPVSNVERNIVEWDCGGKNTGTCCIGEEYLITAQIIEDDEPIKAGMWIGNICDDEAMNYKILMQGSHDQPCFPPHYLGYADGEDLIHLKIASDPETSDLEFAECFRTCLAEKEIPLIPLPCDQIVNLDVGGIKQSLIDEGRLNEAAIEVIWNAEFDEDPYTGERVLLPGYDSLTPTISATTQTEHVAHIPVTGEVTDVYLRLNRFVDGDNPTPCEDEEGNGQESVCKIDPACSCYSFFRGEKIWKWDNVQGISCSSTLIYNNRVVNLFGGGEYVTGMPPVYAGFREPLNINIVDIRMGGRNGQRVADVVVDGTTKHTVVVEVKFSNKPVPDGTIVRLEVEEDLVKGTDSVVVLSSPVVYTHLTYDPIFDPLQQGESRSLAYFEILPLPNVNFKAKIKAISTYDKSQEVSRVMKSSIEIENSVDQPSEEGPTPPETENDPNKTSVISNEIIVYDTLIDSYFEVSGMKEARAGHFSSSYGDFDETTGAATVQLSGTAAADEIENSLYMIGGYDGKNIISSVEIYDFETRTTNYSTPMYTPRAFGQSVTVDDKIYCIGGIEFNTILDGFVVSRKIEYFDIATRTWNPALSSMPEGYGVAFGIAETYGNNIYVLCGCNTIEADNGPGILNDKILRYDIANDSWTSIDISDDYSPLYFRLSPFSFIVNDRIYIYGGTIPKDIDYLRAEIQTRTDFELSKFNAYIFASSYYSNMDSVILASLVEEQREQITQKQRYSVSPFHYPSVGFIYGISSNSFSQINEQWPESPALRDRGQSIYYSPTQLTYFIGGSGTASTTLNNNETINIPTGVYEEKASLSRGRSHFRANLVGRYIYITGGVTSGHQEGWAFIDASVFPVLVEATGNQSSGLYVTLRNDSGEIITDNVDILVRGFINIPGITDAFLSVSAENELNRIIAGDNVDELRTHLQNITNSNSDEFQFGASKKIDENLSLFPVLFTSSYFSIGGSGSTILLPRSEDPFSNLSSLAKSIVETRKSIRDEMRTDATGTSAIDKLDALEEILRNISDITVAINSLRVRDLYDIEVQITVLDETYFGQTICQSNLETLYKMYEKAGLIGEAPAWITRQVDGRDSFQSTNSRSLFGTDPTPRKQVVCPVVKFFNYKDWIPQLKEHLMNNDSTPLEAIEELDVIEDEVPFGSSQLYTALVKMSKTLSDENIIGIDKNIYVNSDQVENLSIYTLSRTIEEINSIDGEKSVPVIYTIFSTSFPLTISSQLDRSQSGIAEELAENTGGHSTVLANSSFLPQVLNFVLSVSGAIGYGTYRKVVDFGAISSITKLTTNFELYSNTDGHIRYRHSSDGRNYSAWTKKYDANSTVNIIDLETRYIEFELVLETGFDTDPDDPYIEPTGVPCVASVCWEYSISKEDYLFLNVESSNGNAQQLETAVTGSIPIATEIKTGAASSDAIHWEEFQTEQRPELNESQKTLLLDRQLDSDEDDSFVKKEILTTEDGLIFTSQYGAWSESSTITVYEKDKHDNDMTISSSLYTAYPRDGQIIMTTKYPITQTLKMTMVNEDKLKVGLKLVNSNHEETICIEGVGFMWSTNRIRPPALSQALPRAINVVISPQNPYISSAIFVSYRYIDINRDEESGTLIRWYKNGIPLLEINDKISFINSDLLPLNRMNPDDQLIVGITPSDGTDYGNVSYSSMVRVAAAPPEATTAQLEPTRSGKLNDRFDTGSTIAVKYDFSSPDTGEPEDEFRTEISWYVNGNLYKTVFYSTEDGDANIKKSLFPFAKVIGQDDDGNDITITDASVYTIGNQIYAEVIPRSESLTGDLIRTQAVTIENSIPIAKNVIILPTTPSINSVLTINFEIDDPDISFFGTQTDQTGITWKKSTDGVTYEIVNDLQDKKMVSPSFTTASERWIAQVSPFDGVDFGIIVSSPAALITPV